MRGISNEVAVNGAIGAIVLAIVLVTCSPLLITTAAQNPDGPQKLASPFKWYVYQGDITDQAIFKLAFEDGRIYQFKISAITSAQFFPREWSRKVGIDNPYIDIVAGSKSVRVDINNDADGQSLIEAFEQTDRLIKQGSVD